MKSLTMIITVLILTGCASAPTALVQPAAVAKYPAEPAPPNFAGQVPFYSTVENYFKSNDAGEIFMDAAQLAADFFMWGMEWK